MPSRAYNVGVPAGQFTILPELTVSGTYDDNVFRTQSNKKDDVYGTVTPRVAIRSNWARHAVGAGASASVRRYSRHTSEDHETYSANLDGVYDVGPDTTVAGRTDFRRRIDDREDEGVRGLRPTEFNRYRAQVRADHRMGPIGLAGGVEYSAHRYDSTPMAGGSVSNRDRDRDRWRFDALGSYTIDPMYTLFLSGRYTTTRHSRSVDRSGFQRNTDSYSTRAGVNANLGWLGTLTAYVGYGQRRFKDSRFSRRNDFLYGGSLAFGLGPVTIRPGFDESGAYVVGGARQRTDLSPSSRFAVLLDFGQRFEATNVAGSPGSMDLFANLGGRYYVMPQFSVGGGARYDRKDFKGIDRTDNVWSFAAVADYELNRHLVLNGRYQHRLRDTSGRNSGARFNVNTVTLGLTARM